MGGGAGYEGHRTPRGIATPVLGREVIYRLDVITCIAGKETARRPAMYRIGSYQYVFRPCHPPGEPRRLHTWSECPADVQSARLGPDGISREYRRGRSGTPVSRRYLRNVARCTVERPSKRPSSYIPKLSNNGRTAITWPIRPSALRSAVTGPVTVVTNVGPRLRRLLRRMGTGPGPRLSNREGAFDIGMPGWHGRGVRHLCRLKTRQLKR